VPIGSFRNPDGTYDGIKMLAAMSGLSEAEVAWTAKRLKHLMHVEKKTKEEAKAVVAQESKSRPWENKP
jgi:TRAP-type C4-dicarboxylate transport system permease large subunit